MKMYQKSVFELLTPHKPPGFAEHFAKKTDEN